jgi:hypothetical protein
MLPALKPRHKTITDRGKQRMLLGIEQCMKCMGWRVVANTTSQPSAKKARLPLSTLGRLNA